MKKRQLILALFCSELLMACSPHSTVNSSPPSGSGMAPNPTSSVKVSSDTVPLASSTPIPKPSVAVSATPQSLPQPSETPEKLEHYRFNIYCDSLEKSIQNRSGTLSDIAVSPNGNEVYVLYANSLSYGHPLEAKKVYPRQVLYKLIGEDLVADSANASISESCGLNSEVEKDQFGNLHFVRPILVEGQEQNPVKGYTFYQLNTQNKNFSPAATLDLGTPNPMPSGRPDARILGDFKIPNLESNAYYYRLSSNSYSSMPAFIQRLSSGRKENIVEKGAGGTPFAFSVISSDKFLYGRWLVMPPYPVLDSTIDADINLPENTQWKQVIDRDSFRPTNFRASLDKRFVYVADSVKTHSIWRVDLNTNKVEPFVGNGSTGFLDGKGVSAQFNRPGEMDVDDKGNLYILDIGNEAIRKVTPSGAVSTLYSAK